uniref:GRF-type domain-containing protein n=1 Tax=Aegilops tauschii subsp. strangulata TaxID=200361 RepID=A0A453AQX6_AEGTS
MLNSSYARSTAGSARRQSHAPVPYRQAPLAYEPAKYCLCAPRAKAPMWISWSDNNLGRRYLACPRGRSFGCGFFQWVDNETSPFLTRLLLDLRNVV